MDEDDFLSRWSRRKRAVAEEAPLAPDPNPETELREEEDEADLLARLNLPLPESLKPGDDFSVFMAKGVPAFLQKRALRMLWRSNPVLANLDGLNDYDDDFTSPELTKKVLATAYKVGRGFVSQQTHPKDGEVVPDPVDEIVAVASDEEGEPPIPPENQASRDAVVHSEDPEPTQRPRRMRFET